MKNYLEEHFERVLENRHDKRWTPKFVGCEAVAAAYPELLGITVISDPYVEPNSIELRTETGTLCAKLNCVRMPE
jgi:hypothetical protein